MGIKMIQIQLTKSYKSFTKGDVIVVGQNQAHALIDKGFAKIYRKEEGSFKKRTTKEMSADGDTKRSKKSTYSNKQM